ncbi:enoyl-CoA hydratase 2, peroxisomal isoform X1 [Cynara cardunculus var. scolymus]|uniref:enoyl-CoA hydratase 2, peroxisomal isoform X1 n=1 Tax=Cynara cardunculus var. scolymus TaxID=59895 RepID=UPI000D62F470|nr:enoyl-CoA hydratase 2, peroxisomal isoform X1 [Cynara cardunculus var. scolymus]XP_024975466.1 enoyl-CoA hydratase 2, peroxisomal isoform X1 [Cynara cardunculus var. scolymus]
MGDDAAMNPELIINHKFPETTYTYSESRDAALYALGIGACAKDALDDKDLKYVYHEDGQQSIQVFPTFAALFSIGLTSQLKHLPGFMFDPRLLLHGQQYIEIYKPLPSNCSIQNKSSIVGLHDKGKATILEVEVLSYEKETGEPLCMNRTTVYLRGAGGFSKSSEPYSFSKYPRDQTSSKPPRTRPFVVHEECTQPSQALLYRLSGDYNPLHSDPMVAEVAGFSRPILHGLCTLGFAVRAIIKTICNGDASLVKAISGRFLLHVYPGETLITEMWLEGLRVLYQTKVKERNRVVLAGFVDLNSIRSSSL